MKGVGVSDVGCRGCLVGDSAGLIALERKSGTMVAMKALSAVVEGYEVGSGRRESRL